MAEHSRCPNCNNSDGGTGIYQCDKCRKVFCSRCSKFGWIETKCPRCEGPGSYIGEITSEREESERRNREREENEERRHEKMREELEAQKEDDERRQEEMLEAMEAQREAQRADIANAWQLQSESKTDRAYELYEAGMHEQALRLALEAIGEIGEQGDPSNLRGHQIASWALEGLRRLPEAHKYYRNQISLLKTSRYKDYPSFFLGVLKGLPNDGGLLESYSITLQEAAPQWNNCTDCPNFIDALVDRGLPKVANTLIQTTINNASSGAYSPAYYPVIDTLLKHRLFNAAQILTDTLMRRSDSLELQAYWLEISALTGKPIEDRLTAFLDNIHYDRAQDLINTFNTIAQRGTFSAGTFRYVRDRISERSQQWAAQQLAAQTERSQQWAAQTEAEKRGLGPWIVGGVVAVGFVGVALLILLVAVASLSNKKKNSNLGNFSSRDSNPNVSNTSTESSETRAQRQSGAAGKTLFLSQGTWHAINVTNGLRGNPAPGGGFYYGYFEYINFAESYRGRTLNVEVKSQYLPTKIELWRGNIPGDDHAWWAQRQKVATSSEGSGLEQKPQLRWVITPGDYTLFFPVFTQSGEVSNLPFFARLDIGPSEGQQTDTERAGESEEDRQKRQQSTQLPPANPSPHVPLSGGVLNGRATSLPQPTYPAMARQQRVSGQVKVQVLIDENGSVVSARAVSGPLLLQTAAVAAAKEAKFTPTMLSGQPVKVEGMIIYNFVLE